MREITLFWKRERLALNQVNIVTEVFEKCVFLGYLERTSTVVLAFMRGICKPDKTPFDMNKSDDYEVTEILSEPSQNDSAWMFVINIKHPLTLLSAKIGKLTVKPGSCVNDEGLSYIIRGSPLSIKIVTTAARMMLKPDRISATTITQSDFRGNQILSDKRMDVLQIAYSEGWYNTPREITLGELANKIGLGRSTVSEHLIKSESKIIQYFLEGDPTLFSEEMNGK
uniref:Putative DNA binding protein n=1 Tax=uncultured marine group II/III euryarchaeote KM3_83_B05 TaxID=1456520 RepID=A0A075HQ42_9EURY|nr:putative DNA binding protein [uncultured marine group II/III euryarchaeote KM3_83_B05]